MTFLANATGFDWLGLVFIPAAMWFILGIPLAIYTGLVAGRMISFNQAKTDAVIKIQNTFADVRETDSPSTFYFTLGLAMNPSRCTFDMLGHPKCKETIIEVVVTFQRKGLELQGVDTKGISGRNLPKHQPLPNTAAFEKWRSGMLNFYMNQIRIIGDEIAACRPNLFAIYFGAKAGVWLETHYDQAFNWAYDIPQKQT